MILLIQEEYAIEIFENLYIELKEKENLDYQFIMKY